MTHPQALTLPPLFQILFLIGGTIAWLGFSEAILKPFSISLMHGLGPKAVALGLKQLDAIIPELIEEGISAPELEAEARRRLSASLGGEWTERNLDGLKKLFDPFEFAKHSIEAIEF